MTQRDHWAEHSCVSANSQGKYKHGDNGKSWILYQLPDSKSKIIHEISDSIHSIRSASIGSTRLARRAGKKQAMSATNERVSRALTSAAGSNGATS
jgi:hypothetical protein